MTQAQSFEAEMQEIWDDDPNKLFWEWHNANERARYYLAGNFNNDWYEWETNPKSGFSKTAAVYLAIPSKSSRAGFKSQGIKSS